MASSSGSERITRHDVVKAVGAIDDTIIAEIIATGATGDELAEALAWIGNDELMMKSGRRWRRGGCANSNRTKTTAAMRKFPLVLLLLKGKMPRRARRSISLWVSSAYASAPAFRTARSRRSAAPCR